MGRIRTIKPEFPHSETIGALSREARLFFIMLWTIADDAGRVRGALGLLSGLLYPYDTDAAGKIEKWAEELIKKDCIRHYIVDGKHYIDIPKWLKHQKIEKPSKSHLPPFEDASTTPHRVVAESSTTDLGPRTLDQDLVPGPLEPASPPETVGTKATGPKQPKLDLEPKKKATRLPEDWKLSHKNTDDARAEGLSEVQMAQQAKAFRNFWIAKAGKDATKMNWDATWHNWVLRFAGDHGCTPRPDLKAATAAPKPPTTDEWKLILLNYAQTSNWKSVYGPAPGKNGCRVPKELLPDDLDQLDGGPDD